MNSCHKASNGYICSITELFLVPCDVDIIRVIPYLVDSHISNYGGPNSPAGRHTIKLSI